MKSFSIIVAFDSGYGIGKNGQLPWRLSSDLKHFKQVTMSVADPSKKNAVIMGRKTWESLPEKARPLPGRLNVILTRKTPSDLPREVVFTSSFDIALNKLDVHEIDNVFVIGGAQVYAEVINHPLCQKIWVTHIKGKHDCDVFFPPISRSFLLISASEEQEEDGICFQYSEYLRS